MNDKVLTPGSVAAALWAGLFSLWSSVASSVKQGDLTHCQGGSYNMQCAQYTGEDPEMITMVTTFLPLWLPGRWSLVPGPWLPTPRPHEKCLTHTCYGQPRKLITVAFQPLTKPTSSLLSSATSELPKKPSLHPMGEEKEQDRSLRT